MGSHPELIHGVDSFFWDLAPTFALRINPPLSRRLMCACIKSVFAPRVSYFSGVFFFFAEFLSILQVLGTKSVLVPFLKCSFFSSGRDPPVLRERV